MNRPFKLSYHSHLPMAFFCLQYNIPHKIVSLLSKHEFVVLCKCIILQHSYEIPPRYTILHTPPEELNKTYKQKRKVYGSITKTTCRVFTTPYWKNITSEKIDMQNKCPISLGDKAERNSYQSKGRASQSYFAIFSFSCVIYFRRKVTQGNGVCSISIIQLSSSTLFCKSAAVTTNGKLYCFNWYTAKPKTLSAKGVTGEIRRYYECKYNDCVCGGGGGMMLSERDI